MFQVCFYRCSFLHLISKVLFLEEKLVCQRLTLKIITKSIPCIFWFLTRSYQVQLCGTDSQCNCREGPLFVLLKLLTYLSAWILRKFFRPIYDPFPITGGAFGISMSSSFYHLIYPPTTFLPLPLTRIFPIN